MTLEVLFRGVLLVCTAGLSLRLLRNLSPSTRHQVWACVLAVCAGLPVLVDLVPAQNLPILPAAQLEPIGELPSSGVPLRRSASAKNAPEQVGSLSSESAIDPWQAIYFAGVFMVLARLGLGVGRVHSLVRSSNRLSTDQLSVEIPPRARVMMLPDGCPHGAMIYGVSRPIIFLPSGFLRWPLERQEAVLRHELAHLHRADPATQFVAEVACALNWFNPIVWFGARAMRMEAELAADEAVLETGILPSSYATALLSVAAELSPRPNSLQGAIPLMSNSKIELRIRRVLTSDPQRTTRLAIRATAFVAVAASVLLVGLRATAASPQVARTPGQEAEAMDRLKSLGLATHIYAADYDDHFPAADSTAKVRQLVLPYAKSLEIFEPVTKGGQVLYNTNLSGVPLIKIKDIAEVPMWFEKFANPATAVGVTYGDGHVKLIRDGAIPTFRKALEKSKQLRLSVPKQSKGIGG